jgi:predicted esterase/catechol 2,3-dioxygenase-like lactoylglutathione lyase family enzyme
MARISGLHHITAIARDPQRNIDFYTTTLGLRLVKKTVNFDDPGTYHFYFGDHAGSPGTILTFFPWPNVKRGVPGVGSVIATAFLIPRGSLGWWQIRLRDRAVDAQTLSRFGTPVLAFTDHDGTSLELIEGPDAERLPAWNGGGVPAQHAIRGFHGVTILVRSTSRLASLLEDTFKMTRVATEADRTRFAAPSGPIGTTIDVVEQPGGEIGTLGAGSVHHVALRAADDAEQSLWRSRLLERGLVVTPVADRQYFRSIYVREPQGVLFEIATDGPGFDIDEPRDHLGKSLKLPPMYESRRRDLERILPPLRAPSDDLAIHTHVHTPGDTSRGLLMLHGTGGDEHDLLGLASRLDPSAAVLSPRGNIDERGQLRFFRRIAEGVFDLDDVRRRAAELARWVVAAKAHYGIDDLTAVGFSNGANVAAAMMALSPGVVRRAVLMRAMVTLPSFADANLRGSRVLLLSGRADPIVPVENAHRLAALLRQAGAEVDHRILDANHGLTREDVEAATQFVRG